MRVQVVLGVPFSSTECLGTRLRAVNAAVQPHFKLLQFSLELLLWILSPLRLIDGPLTGSQWRHHSIGLFPFLACLATFHISA